jgi:hypothetical protein
MENNSISDKITISNDALVHSNNLRNNNLQRRQLKESITEIVRRINQELILAHREGKHFIITSIPITFSISNMFNKDSQRVIWSNVIEELRSKNYRVWISPSNETCRIKITWVSPEDENDIQNQMNIIAKHTDKF